MPRYKCPKCKRVTGDEGEIIIKICFACSQEEQEDVFESYLWEIGSGGIL